MKLYEETRERMRLVQAMDSIKRSFGETLVMFASGMVNKKPAYTIGKPV